jgi:hypothetical protein
MDTRTSSACLRGPVNRGAEKKQKRKEPPARNSEQSETSYDKVFFTYPLRELNELPQP